MCYSSPTHILPLDLEWRVSSFSPSFFFPPSFKGVFALLCFFASLFVCLFAFFSRFVVGPPSAYRTCRLGRRPAAVLLQLVVVVLLLLHKTLLSVEVDVLLVLDGALNGPLLTLLLRALPLQPPDETLLRVHENLHLLLEHLDGHVLLQHQRVLRLNAAAGVLQLALGGREERGVDVGHGNVLDTRTVLHDLLLVDLLPLQRLERDGDGRQLLLESAEAVVLRLDGLVVGAPAARVLRDLVLQHLLVALEALDGGRVVDVGVPLQVLDERLLLVEDAAQRTQLVRLVLTLRLGVLDLQLQLVQVVLSLVELALALQQLLDQLRLLLQHLLLHLLLRLQQLDRRLHLAQPVLLAHEVAVAVVALRHLRPVRLRLRLVERRQQLLEAQALLLVLRQRRLLRLLCQLHLLLLKLQLVPQVLQLCGHLRVGFRRVQPVDDLQLVLLQLREHESGLEEALLLLRVADLTVQLLDVTRVVLDLLIELLRLRRDVIDVLRRATDSNQRHRALSVHSRGSESSSSMKYRYCS
eukprot:Rhum_TRINITY_DN14340_c16_g1::Rhum_TRINITY_DN14340_c16_g1_i1::g.83636::m.83636